MTSFCFGRTKVYEERRVLSSPSLKGNRKEEMEVRIFLGYDEQVQEMKDNFIKKNRIRRSSLFLIWN